MHTARAVPKPVKLVSQAWRPARESTAGPGAVPRPKRNTQAMKINFINPFGTPVYNELIRETLIPYVRPDTELVVTHTSGCPENIDYYYNKHLVEVAVFEQVMRAEAEGYDAVIVGCCYDPGVRVARELVHLPLVPRDGARML